MRLLLIRHGQTPSNVRGLLDTGVPGPGLTELGERQAAAIPEVLDDRDVQAVFVSHLIRTHRTASPLATVRRLDPVVLEGLAEIEAGTLEMTSDWESVKQYLETVFAWASGDLNRRMPGVDTDGRAFLSRFDEAILAAAEGGHEHAAVISHGAAIRTWSSARVRGLDREQLRTGRFDNTAHIEISGDPDAGWDLVGWSPLPLGGAHLASHARHDPTAESVNEAEAKAGEEASE